MKKNEILKYSIAIALIIFALITLFMSSSVIFDWFGIRAKQGNYVPFIVGANFVVSFLYLIAAVGFLKSQKWDYWILVLAAIILFMALIGLLMYINLGGAFEMKTIWAMVFRIIITILFALFAYYRFHK